jgi:hypothetical protein
MQEQIEALLFHLPEYHRLPRSFLALFKAKDWLRGWQVIVRQFRYASKISTKFMFGDRV